MCNAGLYSASSTYSVALRAVWHSFLVHTPYQSPSPMGLCLHVTGEAPTQLCQVTWLLDERGPQSPILSGMWGLLHAWVWLSQYMAPSFIACCELLHTLSFQCRVLGKEAVCTTFFKVIGITRPGIWTHDLPHTRRALYQSATGAVM